MTSILLSRNIKYLRTVLLTSRLSYHSGKAASVNTAIARGLRKSKGLGFRGSTTRDKNPNDLRDKYIERNGLVRRSADPPSPTRPQMTREGWENRPRRGPELSGRSKESPVRIHRGIKLMKTDRELARKKPDPAGRGGGGRHGHRGAPIRTPFDEDLRERPAFRPQKRFDQSNSRSQPTFGGKDSRERPAFQPRERFNESNSSSRRTFGNQYSQGPPKRSAGPSVPMTRERSDFPRKHPSASTGGSHYQQRNNEPGSVETHADQSPGSRYNSISQNPADSPKRYPTAATRREDPVKNNNDGSSTSSTSSTRPVHNRIPLSIPYTTPASEFLYGTSVVEAALKSQRGRGRKRLLYKMYIFEGENRENIKRDIGLEKLASTSGVKIHRIRGDWLRLMDKMSGGRPHNGYILEASPLPRLPLLSLGSVSEGEDGYGLKVELDHQTREDAAINGTSDFVNLLPDRSGRKPMVLLLDGIQDPGNLGGIIRTASFLGASAVAISTRNTASFTPVVLKASAGASENITLFTIQKPDGFIHNSKLAGWKVFAAVAPLKEKGTQRFKNSVSIDNLGDPLSDNPCILMLGSEGDGLQSKLRKAADVEVYIPNSRRTHTVDSLNVSVATGILCNSFLSRNKAKTAPTDEKLEGGPKQASIEQAGNLF